MLYLDNYAQSAAEPVGPIFSKQPQRTEIRLDEESHGPKLTNVDESRLEQQINRFKTKSSKPGNPDTTTPKSQDPALQTSNPPQTTPSEPSETVKKPVSSLPLSLPAQSNPPPTTFSHKRKRSPSPTTENIEKSLKKDLAQSVVPYSKRASKRAKNQESEDQIVDLEKARKRRDKYRQNGNESSDEESSDGTVNSDERDEMLRKYFRKIL